MGPRSLCQQWTLQGAAHRHRYNPSLSCSSGHRSLHMEAVQSSGSEAKLLGFELQLCHSAPCATGDLPSPWHLTPSLVEKFCFVFLIRNWVDPCEHCSEQRLSILGLSLLWSLILYFHKAEARVPWLSHCCYHGPVDMQWLQTPQAGRRWGGHLVANKTAPPSSCPLYLWRTWASHHGRISHTSGNAEYRVIFSQKTSGEINEIRVVTFK